MSRNSHPVLLPAPLASGAANWKHQRLPAVFAGHINMGRIAGIPGNTTRPERGFAIFLSTNLVLTKSD